MHQRSNNETGGLGNKRSSGDHPNYSIIKIGQNNDKSLGLAVTQTTEQDHPLTLV